MFALGAQDSNILFEQVRNDDVWDVGDEMLERVSELGIRRESETRLYQVIWRDQAGNQSSPPMDIFHG